MTSEPQSGSLKDPSSLVLRKTIDFDKMLVFSGYPETNSIHTNREIARSLGLPDAIAQGLHTYAFMCEWLIKYFGIDWFNGGELDVNFLSVVVPGDVVFVKAALVEAERREEGTSLRLAIWVETTDGTKVVAGHATAAITGADTNGTRDD